MHYSRFLFLLILSLISMPKLHAQTHEAALLQKIAKTPDDTAKFALYKDAITYYKRVNMDTAYKLAEEGLQLAEKLSVKKQQAFMLLQKGGLDREQGRMGLAAINVKAALDIYSQLNEERFTALATNELGVIYGIRGDFAAATELFLKSLKIFENLRDTQGLGQTYIKLGTVNDKMNNMDKAVMYYQKALSYSKKDSINLAYLYINMGIAEAKAQNNESAFRYFDSAMMLCVSEKFNNIKISLLLNSGITYAKSGMQQKAHDQFVKGLALAKEGNMPFDVPNLLLNMALLDKVISSGERIPMLKTALALAKDLGDKSLEGTIYQTLADVSAELGDFKIAYSYLDTGDRIEQDLMSVEKNTEIANLQALYELDKSKNKVHELELLNTKRTRERTGVIIISFVLLVMLFSVTYTYRKSKVLNAQLAASKEELSAANTVKDKIFSIIGHDLRAPVSTLIGMLNVLKQDDDNLSKEDRKQIYNSLSEQGGASLDTLNKLLLWGTRQIKGINLQMENFDANSTVADNVKLLMENAVAKKISITNKVLQPTLIYADQSHLDFAVRNLLFNAIKYTNNGGAVEIGTTTWDNQGEVCFYVKDNGVGMNHEVMNGVFELKGNNRLGTNNEKGTGLGLVLCRGFLEQNGGNIWVESKEGVGTTFYFTTKRGTAKA